MNKELDALLREYVEVDNAITALEARKKALRNTITDLAYPIFTETGSKQVYPGVQLKEMTSVSYDKKTVADILLASPLGNAGLLTVNPDNMQAVVGLIAGNPALASVLIPKTSEVDAAIKDGKLQLPEGLVSISKSYTAAITQKDLPPHLNPQPKAVTEPAAD